MNIASDLTALCTANSNLINDVLAQSVAVLADVPAADMATLGSFASNGTQKTVQLVAGGDAILEVPVLDGKGVHIRVVGHTHNPASNSATLNVYLYINGTQTTFIADQEPSVSTPNQPFAFDGVLIWDSTSTRYIFYGNTVQCNLSPSVVATMQSGSASSPTNFAFTVNGSVNDVDSSATLTITQFTAYAD